MLAALVVCALVAPPGPHLSVPWDPSGHEVVARGMPALSADGGSVAFVEFDEAGGRGERYAGSTFVVAPTDGTPRRDRTLSADADLRGRGYRKALRKRVAAFNAELGDYSTLPRLDLLTMNPDRPFGLDASTMLAPSALRASERPVVTQLRHGALIVKIPGVKVLARVDASGFDPGNVCPGYVSNVYADPATGHAVVEVEHMGECACDLTCECEERTTFHTITLPPDLFAGIAAHPTTEYWSEFATVCDEQCQGELG
ncbi:MAG: hypothetical protein AAF721_07570 [Myxococcota bacterium]